MGLLARTFGLQTLADDSPTGDYSANVTPPPRASRGVTPAHALTLPAVLRAVQIISGMGAQLTLQAWRGPKQLEAVGLVAQPDPWRPLRSWLERALVNLATEGNAFLRKHYLDNTVVSLEVLDPATVTIHRTPAGTKTYSVHSNGRTVTLSADEVEHIWFLEMPGRERSLSPIGWCRAAIAGQLDVREYADNWFEGNDVPSGVLSTDQKLDPAAATAWRDKWINPTDGERRGPKVRVIGQGLSYSPIALKPADAQWLESQAFGVLDVARMYGLPGDYLLAAVEGTSLTYANLEMIDAQFLRTTLFPSYLSKIEAAVTACLPRGQIARFDTSALLRPDAKTRAEIDRIYLDTHVVAPAEVRAREGWAGPAPTPKETPA